jgi:hypothetical protein
MDGRSEFEDLAFPSRSSRESDEVGSEDMCEYGTNTRAVMIIAERHLVVVINKRPQDRIKKIVGEFLENRKNGWGGGAKNLG